MKRDFKKKGSEGLSPLMWGGIVPLCDITKGCLPDLFVLTKVENAKEANDELIPGEFADRLVRKKPRWRLRKIHTDSRSRRCVLLMDG